MNQSSGAGVKREGFFGAVAEHMYLTQGSVATMPKKWAAFGFDWQLSHDGWKALFGKLGWQINVLKEPRVVKDEQGL